MSLIQSLSRQAVVPASSHGRPRSFAASLPATSIVLLFLCAGTAAQAQPNPYDPSFGYNGTFELDTFTQDDDGRAVAIDSQGRIVTVGDRPVGSGRDLVLTRLLPNGTVDSSFGWYGVDSVAFDISPDGVDTAADVEIDAQGRIVVLATAKGSGPNDVGFAFARFLPNGGLDPSFGVGGKFVQLFPWAQAYSTQAVDLALDGTRIVAVGSLSLSLYDVDIGVLRLTANGSPDWSFGGGGFRQLYLDLGPTHKWDFASVVQVLPNRDLLVVGAASGDGVSWADSTELVVAKLNSAGNLMSSYGNAGRARFAIGNIAGYEEAQLDAEGNLVVVAAVEKESEIHAAETSHLAVLRIQPNGTLDPAFGNGGIQLHRFAPPLDSYPTSLHILPNGSILVGGAAMETYAQDPPPTMRVGVARLLQTGAPDANFAPGGAVTGSFAEFFPLGQTLAPVWLDGGAQDARGRVVLTGTVHNYGTGKDLAYVRIDY